MKAIDIIRPWLELKGYVFTYAEDMDVVSYEHDGILLRFFTVDSLYVISHSEKLKSMSSDLTPAIQKILEKCIYARPVLRLDVHKIKIKAVQERPIDIISFFNKVSDDVAHAVVIYKDIIC